MGYAVHIEQFDGPLDLLLHLISEAQLDIKDIFVSEITSQYLSYLSELDALDMDAASEFIAMAATLLYIKSRQLLPKAPTEEEEAEESPEELLIRQLRDYQAFKKAGLALNEYLDRARRSFVRLPEDVLLPPKEYDLTGATVDGLMEAFQALLSRREEAPKTARSQSVRGDTYTVRRQMHRVREILMANSTVDFYDLFGERAERMELIVTFMAILEMLLHGELHIKQSAPFAPIQLSAKNLLTDADAEYDYLSDENPE